MSSFGASGRSGWVGGTSPPEIAAFLARAVTGYGALMVKCAVTDAAPEALTVTVA